MAGTGGETDFAELTIGFVQGGIGVIGPLIHRVAPAVALTVLINLRRPERSVFIDLRRDPVSVIVDGPKKSGDVTITIDAEMFHYLLWGKLNAGHAINEKIMLLERDPMSVLNLPMIGNVDNAMPMALDNVLYEMYLINAGAGHLLEEDKIPDDASANSAPQRITIKEPVRENIFSGVVKAGAFGMGLIIGPLLPWAIKKIREEDKARPPRLDTPLRPEFSESGETGNGRGKSGMRQAVLKTIFSRVDIFKTGQALMRGMRIS